MQRPASARCGNAGMDKLRGSAPVYCLKPQQCFLGGL